MYTSNHLLAIKPTMHDVIQKISPRETPARKINHAGTTHTQRICRLLGIPEVRQNLRF